MWASAVRLWAAGWRRFPARSRTLRANPVERKFVQPVYPVLNSRYTFRTNKKPRPAATGEAWPRHDEELDYIISIMKFCIRSTAILIAAVSIAACVSPASSRATLVTPSPNIRSITTITSTVSPTVEVTPTSSPTPAHPHTHTPTHPHTPTPDPLAISPANAAQVVQLAQFGEGKLDQVAWSPDGKLLATAGQKGVYVYDAGTLGQVHFINARAWATSAAFSPDGLRLAVGSVNATVQLWDLDTGDLKLVLTGPGVRVDQVIFSPDGRTLASVGSDNQVQVWDLILRQHLRALDGEGGPARSLAFSPDGLWLAAAGERQVLVWDANTGQLAHTLEHRFRVTSVAVSPLGDSLTLASGNTSGTVEVWDASTGQRLRAFDRLAAPARSLAFSPDGRMLASAHLDETVRLWDVANSSRPLHTLAGHTDLVTSVVFSPDGRRLASSSWDGTARLWGIAP